ncbi:MAG: hypothetical protein MUP02_06215, partial [Actinobacteria bacterium]|nr:hypothetical protein [Actinomycetota bacterium]
MDYRKRILNTIMGKPVDHIPFVPRLDLWYSSNKINNTLPEKYRGSSLIEITRDLGVGFHSVVPGFRNFLEKRSIALQGLGIYDLKSNPYRIVLGSVEFEFDTDREGRTTTAFNTPYGKITTETLYTRRMKSDGASLGHTTKHSIKSSNDLKAVGYIFENIQVEENKKNFKEHMDYVGEDGVCVAFGMLPGSPMHHIMKELMSFERFIYELNDNEKGLLELSEKIGVFYDKVLSISIASHSEIIFLGANYDSFLTWPAFFKQHITPYLKKYSKLAHKRGKYLLTHTDGENKGLIQEYLDADIDVADSICPKPMTSLSLKQVRDSFGDNITIWGGLPS